MMVTANVIRVQLPGGDVYAPAFTAAASKTGARSGLPAKQTKVFNELASLAIDTLNSGGASTITLEMVVHDDSLEAKVVGKQCKPPKKKLQGRLESLAAKKARSFSIKNTKSALTISFEA